MAKQKKREPLLADKWLAGGESLTGHQQFIETTRDNLRLAKRFVLDSDATRYCAEIVKEAPRIVADAQDFAIPPFHRTYIELSFTTWFRAITGREPDHDSDTRIGYLFVGNTVRTLVEANRELPMLYPIQYELWNPFTAHEERELLKTLHTNRTALDIFYWGESALKFMPGEFVGNHTFDVAGDVSPTAFGVDVARAEKELDANTWDREGLRALRANHRFSLFGVEGRWQRARPANPREDGETPAQYMWRLLCEGSCGELRTIIALLLFLNRTSKIRAEREEPTLHNRMWKRKPIPLLKHRVITLHVNPKPHLLRLVAGEGIRRRLHDVRGHFCHNRIARESHHEHEWIEAEEGHMSEMQWYCECGALRWWRHEHQRGHERKGIVTADYKVTE